MEIDGFEIKWLGHSGFFIKNNENSRVIYIDPYNIKEESEKADFILISHGHYDHCSYSDLNKIVKEGTKIFITADCQSKITRFTHPIKMEIVEPNQEFSFNDLKISTIPAYNIDKHFHPKEEHWVGYIIRIRNTTLYFAGDTDIIPEMTNLTGYNQPNKNFVALLPVGGRFTMTAEEAFEAAKIIKPTLAIPIHWGSVVGTEDDAKEFVNLCKEEGINAEILEK